MRGNIALVRNEKLWKDGIFRLEKVETMASQPIVYVDFFTDVEKAWDSIVKEFEEKFKKIDVLGHYYFIDNIKEAESILDNTMVLNPWVDAWLDNRARTHKELREKTEAYEKALSELERVEHYLVAVTRRKYIKLKGSSRGTETAEYNLKKLYSLVSRTMEWARAAKGFHFKNSKLRSLGEMQNDTNQSSERIWQEERAYLARLNVIAEFSGIYTAHLCDKYIKYKHVPFSGAYQRQVRIMRMNDKIQQDIRLMKETRTKVEYEKMWAPGGSGAIEAQRHFESLSS
ncbi:hypothetical protein PMV_074 [Port-miou virus]|uniref:Uncharacterized protein n=1 Tax=Port-miou virus TaxID=1733873 RepID=A0A0N9P6I2_9VIRU|nr:hypothetical protein PMV_074 [Port-miou virus]